MSKNTPNTPEMAAIEAVTRIASALEALAGAMARQADTGEHMLELQQRSVRAHEQLAAGSAALEKSLLKPKGH